MTSSTTKIKQNEEILKFANALIELLNKHNLKINSCHLASKNDCRNQILASIWSNKQNHQIKIAETKEWLNLND